MASYDSISFSSSSACEVRFTLNVYKHPLRESKHVKIDPKDSIQQNIVRVNRADEMAVIIRVMDS